MRLSGYRRSCPIVFFLLAANVKISSSLNSFHREIKFEISFLQAEVDSKDISTVILSSSPRSHSQISCGQHCLNKRGCVTAIFKIIHKRCILLKENLKSSEKYNRTPSQDENTKTIVLRAVDPCNLNPCLNERKCINVEFGFICMCQHDERGQFCEIKLSGASCLHIKNHFSNFNPKNGEYVISSTNSNESFTAYCDMEFDDGGWTQVMKVLSNTTDKTKFYFQEVSSLAYFNMKENYVMTMAFLKAFRRFGDFKQFRFECNSKVGNKTIHIKTNRSLASIVDYMVGAADTLPLACGTFTLYSDDDSTLSRSCRTWNRDTATWGFPHAQKSLRIADHPFWTFESNHFLLSKDWPRFECDTYMTEPSVGDFWNVYVR